MITNRLRTIVHTVAASAVVTAGLGLAAFGASGTANAAVCSEYWSDGTVFYYYC